MLINIAKIERYNQELFYKSNFTNHTSMTSTMNQPKTRKCEGKMKACCEMRKS